MAKELHVAPKSDPKAVVAIMDDDATGRFMATLAAASLSKENGEEFVVIECDENDTEG